MSTTELTEYLERLEDLNPEVSILDLIKMDKLAKEAGPEYFMQAAEQTLKLIGLYLNSQTKIKGTEILNEYFSHLELDTQRLLAAGEISEPAPATSDNRTTALVPRQTNNALDRCIVLNNCTVPSLLAKAADAFRRRNEVVNTVMELAFRILWYIDAKQANDWFVRYFQEHEGSLDPDVIRDALTVALERGQVSVDFIRWVIRWCGDEGLLEHWPTVVYKGDRLLCRYAVRALLKANPPRNTSLAHLKLLFTTGKIGDDYLLKWERTALASLGECVLRIMSLNDTLAQDEDKTPFQGALITELRRLSSLYPAVLLVADQILFLADGCVQLAMALMGLAGKGLEEWDNQVLEFCKKVIRRTFIYDLRAGRSPVETIERLTFNDKTAYMNAYAELDLVSERFDSIQQREKVIGLLAPFYASFRQAPLLAAEATRRYRKLRWLLHEDYLRQALTPEQYKMVDQMEVIWEIAAMAGDARKFLGRQRDLQTPLENMLAAKIEFEASIRERRLHLVRSLIG